MNVNFNDKRLSLFLRFLKENNIYISYLRNVIRQKNRGFICHNTFTNKFYLELTMSPTDLIKKTLSWYDTFEGYCFWIRFHNLWVQYFNLKNKT